MIEGERGDGVEGGRIFGEGEDIDAVVEFLDEAADSNAAAIGGGDGHGVDLVRGVESHHIFWTGVGFLG